MILYRQYFKNYTLGHLSLGEGSTFATLELPREVEGKRNVKEECCIPEGRYDVEWLKRSGSGKYSNVAWIRGVPGRSGILIHNGNWLRNTKGCVLVGRAHQGAAVIRSIEAKNKIWEIAQEIGIREVVIVENEDGVNDRDYSRRYFELSDWYRRWRSPRDARILAYEKARIAALTSKERS